MKILIKASLVFCGITIIAHGAVYAAEQRAVESSDFNKMIDSTANETDTIKGSLKEIYGPNEVADDQEFLNTEMSSEGQRPPMVDGRKKETTPQRGPSSIVVSSLL